MNIIEFFLHLAAWLLVLVSPLLFLQEIISRGYEPNYFAFIFSHIVLMVMFYTNYVLLVPKLFFKAKTGLFAACNILLIVGLSYSSYHVHSTNRPPFEPKTEHTLQGRTDSTVVCGKGQFESGGNTIGDRNQQMPPKPHMERSRWLHEALILLWVCVIAILLRFTKRWFNSQAERKELEREKAEVELKHLKSQLNPHFLFNTLNNIYALIGINQEKAQQAVLDLSKLLRYALYEGEQPFVGLGKEVEFIGNYVTLMKLRLAESVKVETTISIGNHNEQPIAQMLFIALVENAFKHGVSLTQPSFINIKLTVNEAKELLFTIENSNYPKDNKDRSGSGIGLENLKRRLELLYPGKHTYKVEADENIYRAILSIQLNS